MHAWMYVCVYTYTYVCMCMCVYIYTYTWTPIQCSQYTAWNYGGLVRLSGLVTYTELLLLGWLCGCLVGSSVS